MSVKHYLSIAICALILVISSILTFVYVNNYVLAKSYTIGNASLDLDYKRYEIEEYIQEDNVLFCKNLKDLKFELVDSSYSVTYIFDSLEDFDTTKYNYNLFVNDIFCEIVNSEPGWLHFNGYISYFGTDGNEIGYSAFLINISSYSSYSKLSVSIGSSEVAYFNNYLKNNDLVITLVKDSFNLGADFEIPEVVVPITVTNLTSSTIYFNRQHPLDFSNPVDPGCSEEFLFPACTRFNLAYGTNSLSIVTDGDYFSYSPNYYGLYSNCTYADIYVISEDSGSEKVLTPVTVINYTDSKVRYVFENNGITYDDFLTPDEALTFNIYSNTKMYFKFDSSSNNMSVFCDGTYNYLEASGNFNTCLVFDSDCSNVTIRIVPDNISSV